MKLKCIYLSIALIFPFTCFAAMPAAGKLQPYEKTTVKKQGKNSETIIDFYESNKKDAEQIGTLEYTYNGKKKLGELTVLNVYKGYRSGGYGTLWFKKAIIALTAFKPKSIYWEAQPLDNCKSKEDLDSLVRFYKRYGTIIGKKHITDKAIYVEMRYPMALAHALSILHPIFATQEKSPALENKKVNKTEEKPEGVLYKQRDPFVLIVEFANIDLKNTDLKKTKPKAPADAAPANTPLHKADCASIELL